MVCVLTQEYTHIIDGKEKKILHRHNIYERLVSRQSVKLGLLDQEAYAIYMSVKKLAYYLEDADVTLRSDHLPLRKFWQRTL